MRYLHFIVRKNKYVPEVGDLYSFTEDGVIGITTFAFVKEPPTYMSLPTGREGLLDTINFTFQALTQAEFETYIEFQLFPLRDSDYFVITNGTPRP